MKKTTLTNKMMNISVSEKCIATLAFVFIFGLSTGVFFEIMMGSDMKDTMQQYLQNLLFALPQSATNSGNVFVNCLYSIITSVFLIMLIALLGCIGLGVIFASIAIFLKGLSLGYACALITETLSFKSIGVIIFYILPQNTLLISAMLLAAGFVANQSQKLQYGKGKTFSQSFEVLGTSYLQVHILFCALATLGCILQSLLLPMVSRMI